VRERTSTHVFLLYTVLQAKGDTLNSNLSEELEHCNSFNCNVQFSVVKMGCLRIPSAEILENNQEEMAKMSIE